MKELVLLIAILAVWIVGLAFMAAFVACQVQAHVAKPQPAFRYLFVPGSFTLLLAVNLTGFYFGKWEALYVIGLITGYLARGVVYFNRREY